jgi:non-heme chloroperoxidase
MKWIFVAVTAIVMAASQPVSTPAQAAHDSPVFHTVTVDGGVELHYIERGTGIPVVFVHGSLSDATYWNDQLGPFAERGYRAIAYSRRYNPPNTNKAQPGYSAVADADDLAAFILKLNLGKVHVVGHSYGALTALFLAVKHPELIRTLVLAEAPAVSLLTHMSGPHAEAGKAAFAEIQDRMVTPMKVAFKQGDREAGLRTFMAYVLDNPQAWDKMPAPDRQDMLDHSREWDVMMTTGELFPELDPQAVRKITAPALLLSGEKSYRFMALIDEELLRLLPNSRGIVLHGATHRMWYEQPEQCRKAVVDFWREQENKAESMRPRASSR